MACVSQRGLWRWVASEQPVLRCYCGGMQENAAHPPNADRAALAQILTIIADGLGCEETLREIQMAAVRALNDPPPKGDYWERWVPDSEHINALPQPVRSYVHDLATNADPAGMVAENALLRDTVAALEARLRETESRSA